MPNLDPNKLSENDWKEIVSLRAVRDAWGIDDEESPEEFASKVYAAKFDFMSGGPGYVGDLYILQGDNLTEVPPMILRRDKNGHLIVCEPE